MKIPVLSEDPLKKPSKEISTKISSTETIGHKKISSEKKRVPLRRSSNDQLKRTGQNVRDGSKSHGVTQDNYEEVEMDMDSGEEDTGNCLISTSPYELSMW